MSTQQCKSTNTQIVALCGGTDPTEHETTEVGQHILRVAGAQMLARARLPLSTIQLIGRWGSEAVKRYTQEAELTTSDTVASAVARSLQHLTPQLPVHEAPPIRPPDEDTFILNVTSNKCHIARLDEGKHANTNWQTYCGWMYGTRPHRRTQQDDRANWCDKCVFLRHGPQTKPTESDSGSDEE